MTSHHLTPVSPKRPKRVGTLLIAALTLCTATAACGGLPMGARLRLKSSKNITAYPAYIQRIFRAMQTYGVIVADNGSDMYISGAMDARWNNDELNPAFRSLTAGDFEVVQLGWR